MDGWWNRNSATCNKSKRRVISAPHTVIVVILPFDPGTYPFSLRRRFWCGFRRRGGTGRSQRMESPRVEREPLPEEEEELGLLRDMMFRARREGEEPQVPEEQLRSNDQLQQDEVLATFPNRSLLRVTTWYILCFKLRPWSVVTRHYTPPPAMANSMIRAAPRVLVFCLELGYVRISCSEFH